MEFRITAPAVCTGEKGSTTVPARKFFRSDIGHPHYPFSATLIDTFHVFCRHYDAFSFSQGDCLCLFLFRPKNVLQFRYEIGQFHNTEYISLLVLMQSIMILTFSESNLQNML
jgi:hypothetical protein